MPVGAATGFDDGLELVARLQPDIVLVEHHLPEGDGIALCRRLVALPRPPQVILHRAEPAPEQETPAEPPPEQPAEPPPDQPAEPAPDTGGAQPGAGTGTG